MKDDIKEAFKNMKLGMQRLGYKFFLIVTFVIWLFPAFLFSTLALVSPHFSGNNIISNITRAYSENLLLTLFLPLWIFIAVGFFKLLIDVVYMGIASQDELHKEIRIKSAWFLSSYYFILLLLANNDVSFRLHNFVYEHKMHLALFGLVVERIVCRFYLKKMLS